MNLIKAYADKTINGWVAMIRLAHNGKANPVKETGGVPKYYKTKQEAVEAALAHLLAYINGDYRAYDNLNVKDVRKEAAERLFQR